MRRLFLLLATLFPGLVAPAAAQDAATPPAAWIAYAEGATREIAAWLAADDPRVEDLRTYFDAMRPGPDQPAPEIVLRLWIGRDGHVTRVEFPPFAQENANTDLRSLIAGRQLAAPPRGMRQPLRIAVQLTPAPNPEQPPQEPADPRPQSWLDTGTRERTAKIGADRLAAEPGESGVAVALR